MGKPKQKIYWVIARAKTLFAKYDVTVLHQQMADLMSSGVFSDVPNNDKLNEIQTVAFLHCKSKEDFKKIFGYNCLVFECDHMSGSLIRKNLRKARLQGFGQMNTTSGFVFWWE